MQDKEFEHSFGLERRQHLSHLRHHGVCAGISIITITSVASIRLRHLERCHWHPKHKSHQPCGHHHHHHRPITMKINKTPWTNRDIDESGALFFVAPAREADVPKPGCTQENDFPRCADGRREG